MPARATLAAICLTAACAYSHNLRGFVPAECYLTRKGTVVQTLKMDLILGGSAFEPAHSFDTL